MESIFSEEEPYVCPEIVPGYYESCRSRRARQSAPRRAGKFCSARSRLHRSRFLEQIFFEQRLAKSPKACQRLIIEQGHFVDLENTENEY